MTEPGAIFLTTPRLVLRDKRADDLDFTAELFADPRVMRWIGLIRKKVRNSTMTMPVNCCTERLTAYFEPSAIGATIQVFGETAGTSTPR